MSITRLDIGEKTTNQGATPSGKLTAAEFNELVARINELIDYTNNSSFCTQEEYEELVNSIENYKDELANKLESLGQSINDVDARNLGYFYIDSSENLLYGFSNSTDYNAWLEDKEANADLVICQAEIPSLGLATTTGNDNTVAISQKAVTVALADKVDTSSVVTTLEESVKTIPTCSAVNNALVNKLNKSYVVSYLDDSTDTVPCSKLLKDSIESVTNKNAPSLQTLTETEYEALAAPDDSTYYFITEDE